MVTVTVFTSTVPCTSDTVSEAIPTGTDSVKFSSRKLRIFPGLQPFPASVSWTLHSRAYLAELSAIDIANLRFIRRSEVLTASAPMNPAMKTGNGRYSTGLGICSLPRVWKPWYAETKRLCPDMWPPEPKGGLWGGTFRAISCHLSFSVSGIALQAARARLWTSRAADYLDVAANERVDFDRQRHLPSRW